MLFHTENKQLSDGNRQQAAVACDGMAIGCDLYVCMISCLDYVCPAVSRLLHQQYHAHRSRTVQAHYNTTKRPNNSPQALLLANIHLSQPVQHT